jgi:hypothetical protein
MTIQATPLARSPRSPHQAVGAPYTVAIRLSPRRVPEPLEHPPRPQRAPSATQPPRACEAIPSPADLPLGYGTR